MFDFLKRKLSNTIENIKSKQDNFKEDLFNILIEMEVCYDLAEKISEETFHSFQLTGDYKSSLAKSISGNINSTPNNLKKGIILLVGMEGHGKTTTVNKLAYRLIKQNFRVAVTSLDFKRPAGIEQLKENALRFNIPFITVNNETEVLQHMHNYDYIIVDTTGETPTNTSTNLKHIMNTLHPSETLLVINSMLGHSMFTLLKSFKENITVTGSVMTNVDGDKKGGGFLSFYYLMKVPILFISNGEKINNFEKFNSTSITNIVLGEIDMEGLQSLVEDNVPKSIEEAFLSKIMNGIFTYNELLLFTQQTNNIGLGRIMNSIGITNEKSHEAKKNIKIMTSIIQSMTKKERSNLVALTTSRIERISKGSGNSMPQVLQMEKAYQQTKKQMLMLTSLLKRGGDPTQMMDMLKGMMK